LRICFPVLFQVYIHKEAKMIDMIMREGSERVCDLKWRRDFFESKLVILGELLQTLESLTFSEDVVFWVWNNDLLNIYSLVLACKFLHMRANVVGERSDEIVQLLFKVVGFLVSFQGDCFLLPAAS